MEILARGAESEVYLGDFLGIKAIYKRRVPKAYRDPVLDRKINSERMIQEAKVMGAASEAGVRLPSLLFLDFDNLTIVMEYLPGIPMRSLDVTKLGEKTEEIGRQLGYLHRRGIYHGDFTLGNMILLGEEVFVIDYGLSGWSKDVEEFAVDLHVLKRSFESLYNRWAEELFQGAVRGYEEIMGKEPSRIVLERVSDIRLRGRYVDERRD